LTPQRLREAFGRFTTGVTIVTCLDADGLPVGLTANSFGSLSLEPALVQWSLRCRSVSLSAFEASERFVVNVLAEGQVELSRRFATPAPDKFAEGAWSPGLGGLPVLAGSAAVFECRQVQRLDAGDHVLFIGEVERAVDAPVPPLVFQSGKYRLLGEVL
jgi:flavin reductase (DIM6/NTAB) family NADH-FMN oxidoreductase RutF